MILSLEATFFLSKTTPAGGREAWTSQFGGYTCSTVMNTLGYSAGSTSNIESLALEGCSREW